MKRLSVLAWLGLLTAGCSFHTDVPGGKQISCASGQACPSGYTCRPAIGRCVSVADLAQSPAGITHAEVAPLVGGAGTTFSLQLTVSAPLARPPLAYFTPLHLGQAGAAETFPFTCAACDASGACACAFTPDPAHLPPQGALQLEVEIVDRLGNAPPPDAVGSVGFDLTPPDLEGTPSFEFTAPPGVPVAVSALGPGGSLRACFGVDEDLEDGGPVVWAATAVEDQPGPGALTFVKEPGYPLGLRYCYRATLDPDAGLPDGERHLLAALTDVAGNRAVREVPAPPGGLALDATAPPAPDQAEDGGLRYWRAPHGDGQSDRPAFALSSAGAALGEAGTLRVYADATGEQELARADYPAGPVDPPLALPGPDAPEVYVELVDRAGNRSPGGPQRVRSVDYVAALGGKVAGDTDSNPHACFGRTALGPALLQGDDEVTEQDGPAGPSRSDGGEAVVAGQPSWRQRFPGVPTGVDSRTYAATAYDSARGRVVAFLSTTVVGTWLFDGRDWAERPGLRTQPSPRSGHAMAYDAARDRVVLFGGAGLCDTWEWDDQTWRYRADCHTATGEYDGPSPRDSAALAYDPERRRVVLLGGQTPDGHTLGDAWEWDGQAWARLPTAASPAPARSQATLAWAGRPGAPGALLLGGGRAVLADGGSAFDPTWATDTWLGEWDGRTYQWRSTSGRFCPASDAYCGLAFVTPDPAGQGFWQLMQESTSIAFVSHLSRWSGLPDSGWQPLWDRDDLRGDTALVGLPALGSALLWAGQSSGGSDDATFACAADGGCALLHPSGFTPLGRWGGALAFDERGQGLLVGGLAWEDSIFGAYESPTNYLWTGDDWLSAPADPPGRWGAGLAYLPGSDSYVLLGGEHYHDPAWDPEGDLWRYRGGAWTLLAADAGQDVGGWAALARVPDAGEGAGEALLLISEDGPTYLLDLDGGLGLTPRAAKAPSTLMAYDERRGVAVAPGTAHDLYELAPGAGTWRQVLSNAPAFDALTYDRTLGRVLLLGRGQGGALPGDAWTWDGAALTQLAFADPEGDGAPPVRTEQALAYDPLRDRSLLVGGQSSAGSGDISLADVWELRRAELRPGEVCRLDYGAARAGPGAVLTGLSVRAEAEAGAAPAVLLLYRDGAWREVARCTPPACGPGSPGLLAYQAPPAEAAQLVTHRDRLGVALAPDATNGPSAAQVGVRRLRAVFSYRLP